MPAKDFSQHISNIGSQMQSGSLVFFILRIMEYFDNAMHTGEHVVTMLIVIVLFGVIQHLSERVVQSSWVRSYLDSVFYLTGAVLVGVLLRLIYNVLGFGPENSVFELVLHVVVFILIVSAFITVASKSHEIAEIRQRQMQSNQGAQPTTLQQIIRFGRPVRRQEAP